MEAFIGNQQNQKLLRVYLLKNAYELTRGLEKQLSSSLASSCLIIRRYKIKNDTEFGYKQSLKTGLIKRIHFIYLPTTSQLVTFLWAHLTTATPLSAGIYIDSLNQYLGQRYRFQQNGRLIGICINLLQQLAEISVSKTRKIRIGFSFCYNSFVFKRTDFMNYMESFGITCWEISSRDICKNGSQFQSQPTKGFLAIYGGTGVLKHQGDDHHQKGPSL